MAKRDERRAERDERRPDREARRGGAKEREAFGTGAVGAWTDEELERLPETGGSDEAATRDQDHPGVMREGEAIGGRRKAAGEREPGAAKPYGAGTRVEGETPGRDSSHPGARGTRRRGR